MFKLLRLRLLAAVAFCLLLPASAYADPVIITNQLNDNVNAFEWTVTFSGLPAPGTSFPIPAHYTNLPREWGNDSDPEKPEMIMALQDPDGDGIFRLVVLGRHLQGPHNIPGQDRDIDPANIFSLRWETSIFLAQQISYSTSR